MDATEAETISRKKARRVSFADTTAVHVFDRDDDEETPPELRPGPTGFESHSAAERLHGDAFESDDSRDSGFRQDGGGDETEAEDEPEPFVKDMDFSPGSTAGSVTSNDDDNLFGPVSSSFIMSGLASEASDDDIHDITLDSTAFSLHFRNILPSDEQTANSAGSIKTPIGDTGSSDSRSVGKRKRVPKSRLANGSGEIPSPGPESNGSMSLVTLQRKTFDYGKLSPSLESLLQEVNRSIGFGSPNRDEGVNAQNEVSSPAEAQTTVNRSQGISSPAKAQTPVSSPGKNQTMGHQHNDMSDKSRSEAAAPDEQMSEDDGLNEPLNSLPVVGSPTTLTLKTSASEITPCGNEQLSEDFAKYQRRKMSRLSCVGDQILSLQAPPRPDHTNTEDDFVEASVSCQNMDIVPNPVHVVNTPTKRNSNDLVLVSESPEVAQCTPIAVSEANGQPEKSVPMVMTPETDRGTPIAVSKTNEQISHPSEGSISSLRNKRQELSSHPWESQSHSDKTPEGNLMKLASPLLNFSLLHSGSQSFLNFSRKLSTSHAKSARYESPLTSLSKGKLNFDFEVCDSDSQIPRTPIPESSGTDLVSSPLKGSVSLIHDQNQQLLVEAMMSLSKIKPVASEKPDNGNVKLKPQLVISDHAHTISQSSMQKSPQSVSRSSATVESSVIHASTKETNNSLACNSSLLLSSHALTSSSGSMLTSTLVEHQACQSSENLTQHATEDLASRNLTPNSKKNMELPSILRPDDAHEHHTQKSLSTLIGENQKDGSIQPNANIHEYGCTENQCVASQTEVNKSVSSPGGHDNDIASSCDTVIPLKCLDDIFLDVLRASSIQFSSVSMLNEKEIDIFESLLQDLKNALKFERLLAGMQSTMTPCQSSAEYSERLVEANQFLYMVLYQHAKKKLLLARRDALQKRLQMLRSGCLECQKLRHASFQLTQDLNRNPSNIGFNVKPARVFPYYNNENEQQSVISLQKGLANLEQKLNALVDYFSITYRLETASYETVVESAHDLLRKKSSCRTFRKNMLLWKYTSISNQNDGSYVVLNYSEMLSQRFFIKAVPHSSSCFRNSLITANIMKKFPNVNACIALDFVFNTKEDQMLSGSRCFQQVTQATNIILGTLLDVLEEVQAIQIAISNLVSVGFCLHKTSQLGLELCFMNFNTGRKLVLVLDLTSLRYGLYPSEPPELHTQISVSQTTLSPLSCREITYAIQLVKGGVSMLMRVCQCISRAVRVSAQ